MILLAQTIFFRPQCKGRYLKEILYFEGYDTSETCFLSPSDSKSVFCVKIVLDNQRLEHSKCAPLSSDYVFLKSAADARVDNEKYPNEKTPKSKKFKSTSLDSTTTEK